MAEDSIRARRPAFASATGIPPPGHPGGKTGGVGSRKDGRVSSQNPAKAARPKELRALFEVFQDGEGAFPWGGIPAFGGKFHTRTAWIGVKGQCELLQDW